MGIHGQVCTWRRLNQDSRCARGSCCHHKPFAWLSAGPHCEQSRLIFDRLPIESLSSLFSVFSPQLSQYFRLHIYLIPPSTQPPRKRRCMPVFAAPTPDTVTHAISLRGAQLTWAILNGEKPFENRQGSLLPGWHVSHVWCQFVYACTTWIVCAHEHMVCINMNKCTHQNLCVLLIRYALHTGNTVPSRMQQELVQRLSWNPFATRMQTLVPRTRGRLSLQTAQRHSR